MPPNCKWGAEMSEHDCVRNGFSNGPITNVLRCRIWHVAIELLWLVVIKVISFKFTSD
jgi:hypothetical protein